MVDPITAVATATAAFNTIKSAFAAGRDIEGMAGDLGRWMHVSFAHPSTKAEV